MNGFNVGYEEVLRGKAEVELGSYLRIEQAHYMDHAMRGVVTGSAAHEHHHCHSTQRQLHLIVAGCILEDFVNTKHSLW